VKLMKKILITGANSYVGTNVGKWLMKNSEKYFLANIDMKNPNWQEFDFSKFDVVFHVAGIAHIKESKKNQDLFFKVNTDLAIETAITAKKNGIKQFIFMSSMSVYGIVQGEITRDTDVNPTSFYGKSKLNAEKKILQLSDDKFKVVILRPPLIYGNYCPGNFSKLVRLSLINPFYPKVENKRSIIYIDNLSEYIRIIINDDLSGVFHPQNDNYVSTNEIITTIRKLKNKKTFISKFFNCILLFNRRISNKVYGSLYYSFLDDITIDKNYTFLETIEFAIKE